MGSKGHGTYAKLYGDVWTHPKTLRLADALEALGVPRRWAVREAVGQLHELLVWCLGSSDTGDVGHLRPEMFARVVGWTEARSAAALVEAWRASGYLDQDGNSWRLHDFEECASDLLAKRRARAEARKARTRGQTTDAARTPPGEPTDAARTPDGRRADALARASGNGSGNGNGMTPSESPPSPVADAPGGGRDEPCTAIVVAVPVDPRPDTAAEVAAAWAAECPRLPQPAQPLAPGIRARLVAAAKRERGRDWAQTFRRVADSDFLAGRKTDWRASLMWAVGVENLAKLDSGAYDNGEAVGRRIASGSATALLFGDGA